MSVQEKNFKASLKAPIALARPIFTPSADIGSALCWVDPHSGELQVRTEPLEGFPRMETDSAGRRTLLRLGTPIWVAKHLMVGYPDADALPDALWDVIEAIFDEDVNDGRRDRWLASPPVFEHAV